MFCGAGGVSCLSKPEIIVTSRGRFCFLVLFLPGKALSKTNLERMFRVCCFFFVLPQMMGLQQSGKSKGGLSKGGLGPKGANWAKNGPFGAISALPPVAVGCGGIGPDRPRKGPDRP